MTEVQYQNWKQVRARGFAHYILVRGILWRGVPFGFLMAVADIVWPSTDRAFSLYRCIVRFAVLALIFGFVTGKLGWSTNERASEIHKKDEDHVA
jgi:hypothetical protein